MFEKKQKHMKRKAKEESGDNKTDPLVAEKQDREKFDEILGRYRTKGRQSYRAPDRPVKFKFQKFKPI